MEEKEPTKFRIRLDDDISDTPLQEEMEDLRIKKLSQRITLITVLIPCMVAAILFFAYIDINKRVGRVHDTGTSEVQTLSKDLDSSISSLSQDQANYRESLNKQISSIEANLKEATIAIRQIRTARKMDNQEFNGRFVKIEKSLTPIRENLKKVSSEINTFNDKIEQKLVQIVKAADKTKNELQTEISTLSSEKINKKTLDLAIINEQVRFQEKLNKITGQIEKQLESVRNKIEELEKLKASSEKSEKITPKTSKSLPPGKPENAAVTPKPETIVEQNIQ